VTLDLNFLEKFLSDDPIFDYRPLWVDWTHAGVVMTLRNETDNPQMWFTKYLFGGRVDLTMQAAPGAGIATVFALFSDDRDEIDWVSREQH